MKVQSICAILVLSTLFHCAHAAQIIIPAFSDGEIDSAGVLGITADDSSPTIRTLRSGNSNVHHGAFVFDLSAIPTDSEITSVDFQVSLAGLISNTGDTAVVEFHGYSSDSSIKVVDFDTPAASDLTRLASHVFAAGADASPPIGATVSIPLATDRFRQILDSSDPYMTLRSETVNFVTFHVHSIENEIGAMPPSLVINAETVPEPATRLWLLPFLGLFVAARKRR